MANLFFVMSVTLLVVSTYMTDMRTLLLLLLVTVTAQAQNERKLGGYATLSAETFYKDNFQFSIGLRYKETRVGYIRQQAVIIHERGLYVRKGFIVEQGIGNVDRCAYFSVGVRILTTNDNYVSVVPHFTTAFRFKHWLDVPITLSTFKHNSVASIGIRVLF